MSGERDDRPGLVDIHSHILPGLDDGADDTGVMVEMLRISLTEGVQTIVATPHASHASPEQITIAVEAARETARKYGLAIEVLAGSEIRFSADLATRYRDGELLSINESAYLLVEFPFTRPWPPLLMEAIYNLRLAGGQPIIAHAERYPVVQDDPGALLPLIDLGVLAQVNAEALTERYRSIAARTAETLVRSRLAHIIASDAHNASQRPPHLREALEQAVRLTGAEHVDRLRNNAASIARGQAVVTPAPDLDALRQANRGRSLNPLKLWRRSS